MSITRADIAKGDTVVVKTWDREQKAWGDPIRWVVTETQYAHEYQGPMFVGKPLEGRHEGKPLCERIDFILAVEKPADDDLVFARCLSCGYSSEDPLTLELWNGYGDHGGPTWSPVCSDHSVWIRRDGSVAVVNGDASDIVEVEAPEDGCSSCGEVKKVAHLTSSFRMGIDPCDVLTCRDCAATEGA